MVYDKRDQDNTLYDSCNPELADTFVGSIKLEDANNNYSILNKIKFDLTNENDKYLLYRQFGAWYCKGCSVAPLTMKYIANCQGYLRFTIKKKAMSIYTSILG